MNMKAAASLTGSLLARKGAAYPAAYSAPSTAPTATPTETESEHQPQRAYNDPRVIASAPPQAASPETADPQDRDTPFAAAGDMAEPVAQNNENAESIGATGLAAGTDEGLSIPQAMDKMGRVRLSVRLDPDRYLRVKMASARTRWSAQDIVIAALDRYLGGAQGGSPHGRASDAEGTDHDDEDGQN